MFLENLLRSQPRLNVFDLEKGLPFQRDALGLGGVRRIKPEDGSFIEDPDLYWIEALP